MKDRDGDNQAAAARRIGISQPALNGLLQGKNSPKADTIIKIARAYGVSTDWILGVATGNETEEIQRLRRLIEEIRVITGTGAATVPALAADGAGTVEDAPPARRVAAPAPLASPVKPSGKGAAPAPAKPRRPGDRAADEKKKGTG